MKKECKRHLHHRSICMVLALCLTLLLAGCTAKSQTAESQDAKSQTADYGVFLSVTEDLSALRDYKTVVIDAQYFSGAEIEAFRADGHTVYSYLNVGSLENFRDYYATYAPLTLGAYEHWDEERWIDVADQRWQRFLTETLIPALLEKHIDGFFVDNCDVYAYAPTREMRAMAGRAHRNQSRIRLYQNTLGRGSFRCRFSGRSRLFFRLYRTLRLPRRGNLSFRIYARPPFDC